MKRRGQSTTFQLVRLALAIVLGVSGYSWSALAQNPDLLVCSTTASHSVKRYDGTTGAFLGNFIPSIPYPHGIVYGPDGKVYVNFMYDPLGPAGVQRFDGSTGAYIDTFVPIGSGGLTAARGMVFGTDGNLYVSSNQTHTIKRYDGSTGDFLGDFVPSGAGGLEQPIGLSFGPEGDLYVVSRGTSSIKKYDKLTGTFLADFVASGAGGLFGVQNLVFRPDGKLYVTDPAYTPPAVLRYDAATGSFLDAFVENLSGAYDLVFDLNGNLYVNLSGGGGNVVARFNGVTGASEGVFTAPGSGLNEPRGMVFMPAQPSYSVCLLYDPTKAVKSGATMPIKLQLCDGSGANLSSASIVLHATGVTQTSTNIDGPVQDAGNANPDYDFRYDASLGDTGGYIFNLKTTGLTTGSYVLKFQAGADPAIYSAPFQVK